MREGHGRRVVERDSLPDGVREPAEAEDAAGGETADGDDETGPEQP